MTRRKKELPGVTRIVSGGQTGADVGGLEAALALGIPHGGWCPKGRKCESGTIPAKYKLRETASAAYYERTEWNVRDSDGTVVFAYGVPTGGSALTVEFAGHHEKPCLVLDLERTDLAEAARALSDWLASHHIRVLNVAGSRESKAPGIAEDVRQVLEKALRAE